MKASLDLTTIGTAMVDIPICLTQEQFSVPEFAGLRRGVSNILPAEAHSAILNHLQPAPGHYVAGGAAANTAVAASQLGGACHTIGRVGDDVFGRFFIHEAKRHRLSTSPAPITGAMTGSVVALIEPDAERTLCISPGTNVDFGPDDIDRDAVRGSQWTFIQGHLLRYGPRAVEAIELAISEARKNSRQIALSLATPAMIQALRDTFVSYTSKADLVIGNEDEAKALLNCDSREKLFSNLSTVAPKFVVTLGSEGAMAMWDGEQCIVPGLTVSAIDSTGAGDAFAGGLLYGMSQGMRLREAMEGANRLAARVVTQMGARLDLPPAAIQELFHNSTCR
jgi:sugar/nucleoside kinase (ribokinase family)